MTVDERDTNALNRVQCIDFYPYVNVSKRFLFRSPELMPRLKPDYLIHWGFIFFFSREGRIILDTSAMNYKL